MVGNMFDTFVFDFDLTLADSSKAILKCFKHTFAEFGYDIPDDTSIYNTIGLTLEQAFEVLAGVKDAETKKEMRACYVKKADEVMAADTVFFPEAVNALEKLKSKNFKVGIVSTKYRYRIVETFEKQGVSLSGIEIIGGEDVSAHKPYPSGLNMIIERLGSEKNKVLYVGDSYIDAETAENAGVSFGGVTTGSTTKEKFAEYHCFEVAENVGKLIEVIL